MSIIKTYDVSKLARDGVTFSVERMEAIYDRHKGSPDAPHRHDYYTILLVKKGSGKHTIDFHEFELAARQVYFISPEQVHRLVEEERSEGIVLTFSQQFMIENSIEQCFVDDLHLFQDFGYAPPLELEVAEFGRLNGIAEQIYAMVATEMKFKYQGVGALLKLFLIHCNNSCTLSVEQNTQRVQASVILLRGFKDLLNQHFKAWHKVQQYAHAMHITSDYLNASVKSLTGKSAKEHIQSRLLIAAKRLLLFSDLNNKSIAYELGFSEPANFSQFFKRCTGISPTQFVALH